MVKCHEGESIVVLFVVSFDYREKGDNIGEEAVKAKEENERRRFGLNDPSWDHVLSFDEELLEVDVDNAHNYGVGPSSVGRHTSSGTDTGYETGINDERGDGGNDEGGDGGEDEGVTRVV
ncbi:hypothetical protein CJ030_MR1G027083 [Morella rubra]|uniref:Uncharacterized protein n=1 Tax=Morella rubra TaxID=262757 RepID=A0A6A1UFQ5_9ROSI|nr:hypothetical protein CJ030_MR0G027090 [Morella rubra]KAB1225031.1 hypothetical protein CJ030_MR1G027083 [Morella rubra]